MGFSGLLHLLQDEGGNLRRRIGLAVGFDPGVAVGSLDDLVGDELLVLLDHRVVVAAADQALHCEEGALGISDRLALGRLADEAFAIVRESNDRGRRSHALSVLNDFWSFAVHDGDARIGRAEVDTDDLAHDSILFSAAGWRALTAPWTEPPGVQIRAMLRR
jgi:hypothetical protein